MEKLDINDFSYTLPADRIASFPLKNRDDSKLLVYDKGKIEHASFRAITGFLPANAFLFFNNTRVIPARLFFRKETGATIEVFLLHPLLPSRLLTDAMQCKGECTWECTIGNVKRWPENLVLQQKINGTTLSAARVSGQAGAVRFLWDDDLTFAEILESAGQTPLPPYLNRSASEEDRSTYQTIYSQNEGAVAAPTAGLHFTEKVFADLKQRQIEHDFLTLHVSAGTFQPVKAENAIDHVMHKEQVIVTRSNVQNLLKPGRFIIPVGTTSMRTIESLYWFGAGILRGENAFEIFQDTPYQTTSHPPVGQALEAILSRMDEQKVDSLTGETAIFIRPGYRFRICRGLITNFHQPASTLILLVASFIGDDWRRVYREALDNNYRFLSYGDSSLILPTD